MRDRARAKRTCARRGNLSSNGRQIRRSGYMSESSEEAMTHARATDLDKIFDLVIDDIARARPRDKGSMPTTLSRFRAGARHRHRDFSWVVSMLNVCDVCF